MPSEYILPGTASTPALARGEIAAVLPRHAVFTVLFIVVLDLATTVGPERVVIAIAFSSLACIDSSLRHIDFSGSCESTYEGTSSQEETREGNHIREMTEPLKRND